MSIPDYLTAFRKSKCSPVVILPSMAGSKLSIVIDCPELQKERPSIFSICGWNSCRGGKSPKKEYLLWISNFNSPISLMNGFLSHSKECFGYFFGFDLKKNLIKGQRVAKRPGFEVKLVGDSDDTKYTSQCAFDGISNLLPIGLQPGTKLFGIIVRKMTEMGYVKGLTMQAAPYDWRVSYKDIKLNKIFWPIVQDLSDITDKKVAVIGHSLGNKIAL